jgi:hypothetical protein
VNTRAKIDPVPDVQPNPVKLVRQLQETGQPAVLTINEEVKLVVQDPTSYQMLLELVDRLDTIEAIREGMKEIDEGKGLSLAEAMDQVRIVAVRHGARQPLTAEQLRDAEND